MQSITVTGLHFFADYGGADQEQRLIFPHLHTLILDDDPPVKSSRYETSWGLTDYEARGERRVFNGVAATRLLEALPALRSLKLRSCLSDCSGPQRASIFRPEAFEMLVESLTEVELSGLHVLAPLSWPVRLLAKREYASRDDQGAP